MMKSLIRTAAVAAVLSVPFAAFAQGDAPLTRAQVYADLVQIEQAGYTPGGDNNRYPEDILSAEAKVAAMQRANVASSGAGVDAH